MTTAKPDAHDAGADVGVSDIPERQNEAPPVLSVVTTGAAEVGLARFVVPVVRRGEGDAGGVEHAGPWGEPDEAFDGGEDVGTPLPAPPGYGCGRHRLVVESEPAPPQVAITAVTVDLAVEDLPDELRALVEAAEATEAAAPGAQPPSAASDAPPDGTTEPIGPDVADASAAETSLLPAIPDHAGTEVAVPLPDEPWMDDHGDGEPPRGLMASAPGGGIPQGVDIHQRGSGPRHRRNRKTGTIPRHAARSRHNRGLWSRVSVSGASLAGAVAASVTRSRLSDG